jgi:putative ABC transport system permease protein
MQHRPWWQRYWFDLLLLVPAAYGLWSLQRQSISGMETAPDPLRNPFLLLVPALGIFAVALFTLRLVPRLMEFISILLRPTKSVGMLMAARTLARTPAFYSAPLILLVLTLGLSAFTASLAGTLDSQLTKQVYYNVGADMSINQLGTTFSEEGAGATYTFASLEDHRAIPGVETATRVGRYNASAAVAGGAVEGTFLGLQRETFPQVAYWQRDFARSNSVLCSINWLPRPTAFYCPPILCPSATWAWATSSPLPSAPGPPGSRFRGACRWSARSTFFPPGIPNRAS